MEGPSLVATRSARHPRFVSRPPTDAPRPRRLTGASALTGRSTRTPLAVAWGPPLRPRACLRLRGRARSNAPAEAPTPIAATSTRPSPVVAAASVAGPVRRHAYVLVVSLPWRLRHLVSLAAGASANDSQMNAAVILATPVRNPFTPGRGWERYGPRRPPGTWLPPRPVLAGTLIAPRSICPHWRESSRCSQERAHL
jgi:hypothetical protein